MKFTLLLAAMLLTTVPAIAENSVTIGNTIISSGNRGPDIPVLGGTIGNKKTIECTSSKGCVLHLQAMVEIASAGAAGFWQLCVAVDKFTMNVNPSCPTQGTLPAKGTMPTDIVTGNVLENAIVKKGKHTIQMGGIPGVKAKIGSWQTTYTILKE